jgi:hypothetical protein
MLAVMLYIEALKLLPRCSGNIPKSLALGAAFFRQKSTIPFFSNRVEPAQCARENLEDGWLSTMTTHRERLGGFSAIAVTWAWGYSRTIRSVYMLQLSI